ncbi:MAG: energy transducer TonB [Terriglobia bacterium]
MHSEAGVGLRESAETSVNKTLKDSDPRAPQFTLISVSAEERRRWGFSFAIGLLFQILFALLLLWIFALPPVPREPEGTSYLQVIRITLPRMIPHRNRRLAPELAPQPLRRTAQLPTIRPKVASPRLTAKLQPHPIPLPRTPTVVHPQVKLLKPAVNMPQIHVGAFSSRTEAANGAEEKRNPVHVGGFNQRQKMAMLKVPRWKVQTGGFGTPNGLPGPAEDQARTNVSHLGSFDRPEGPASGNGTGGEHGAAGLVASAGFGNGIAGPRSEEGNNTAGNDEVRSAGFAGAESMTRAAPQRASQPQASPYEPVEITEKPDPVYTAEARRLHIQGDVLLRVVFTSSGHVHVLGVEHGLGHGLDQAAIRAAEQIQFRPARRNGRPVNTTAILHILFQLAD